MLLTMPRPSFGVHADCRRKFLVSMHASPRVMLRLASVRFACMHVDGSVPQAPLSRSLQPGLSLHSQGGGSRALRLSHQHRRNA